MDIKIIKTKDITESDIHWNPLLNGFTQLMYTVDKVITCQLNHDLDSSYKIIPKLKFKMYETIGKSQSDVRSVNVEKLEYAKDYRLTQYSDAIIAEYFKRFFTQYINEL